MLIRNFCIAALSGWALVSGSTVASAKASEAVPKRNEKELSKHSYQIWCTGNCDVDAVPSSTEPGVVLMGGGVSISSKLCVLLLVLLSDLNKFYLPLSLPDRHHRGF